MAISTNPFYGLQGSQGIYGTVGRDSDAFSRAYANMIQQEAMQAQAVQPPAPEFNLVLLTGDEDDS